MTHRPLPSGVSALPRLGCALAVLLAACGGSPAPESSATDTAASAAGGGAAAAAASATTVGPTPPLGRYVCRQGMTTMGYLTLRAGGTYEVSGVQGRYAYDAQTGKLDWQGGSYDEWNWDGVYKHVARPEGDGRPDEDIIRLTSEADNLRISCYKMAEG